MFGKTLAAFLLSLAIAASAQQIMPKHAPHAPADPDMIDGAVHPEQISQRTAWRLWMLAVSAKPSEKMTPEQEAKRMNTFLQIAGFTEDEANACKTILENLRSDYSSLLRQHNKLITEGKPDENFTARRDALMDAARTALLNQTAFPEKMEKFLGSEKMHMMVPKSEEERQK